MSQNNDPKKNIAMKSKKEKIGVVIGNKMQKTIVVRLERRTSHNLYKKVATIFSKIKAHDEKNLAKIGDTVRIAESRPLSKTKRWRLVDVIKK